MKISGYSYGNSNCHLIICVIGVGRCFIVRGQTCFQLSQLHDQLRSDVRSLLCLLCRTKHAKAMRGLETWPQDKFENCMFRK